MDDLAEGRDAMNEAEKLIQEAIQVLDDNTADYEALLRASGTAIGKLGNAIAALSSPCACEGRKPLAEAKGWAEEWKRGGFFEEEPDDPGTRILMLFDQQIIPEEARVPVRVLILAEPQGE